MRIKSLEQLIKAADDKRAVFSLSGHYTGSRKPAAFVVNYTARVVHNLIEEGLYLYEPKGKGKNEQQQCLF